MSEPLFGETKLRPWKSTGWHCTATAIVATRAMVVRGRLRTQTPRTANQRCRRGVRTGQPRISPRMNTGTATGRPSRSQMRWLVARWGEAAHGSSLGAAQDLAEGKFIEPLGHKDVMNAVVKIGPVHAHRAVEHAQVTAHALGKDERVSRFGQADDNCHGSEVGRELRQAFSGESEACAISERRNQENGELPIGIEQGPFDKVVDVSSSESPRGGGQVEARAPRRSAPHAPAGGGGWGGGGVGGRPRGGGGGVGGAAPPPVVPAPAGGG